MPRHSFGTRFTQTQREACVRSVLEQGRSCPATRRLAAAGGLVPDQSFEPSVDTIRIWVRAERTRLAEAQAATGAPDYVAEVLTRTVAVATLALDLENRRISQQTKHRRPLDPARIAGLARAGKDLLSLSRTLAQAKSSTPESVATDVPEQGDWLSALPVDGDLQTEQTETEERAPGIGASDTAQTATVEPKPRSVARFAFDASALELADVAREANR